MANQNGWDTVGEETPQQGNNGGQPQEDKLDFLVTPEGETEIRVLDEAPYYYQEWWAVKGNDGKGSSIPYKGKDDLLDKANKEFMAKVFKEADTKGLKNGSPERKKFIKAEGYDKQPFGKLKNKYLIHVLDRSTGEVKLLDKGKGLFEKLKGFAMHKYHGDLRTYDVTIVRKGIGWRDTEYDAMACPEKTPLTEAELTLYNEKKVDLHKLKSGENLTPEQCLFIAEGGLWSELTKEGTTEVQQMAEENYQANSVPGSLGDSNNDTQVDTSKEGALSNEELANVNF